MLCQGVLLRSASTERTWVYMISRSKLVGNILWLCHHLSHRKVPLCLGATHLTSQTEGLRTIDDRQQILGIDHVSGPHKKLLYCSAMARPERRLHFHGFERQDDFARLDALTAFDGNR